MHHRELCRRGVPLRGLSGHPRPCRAIEFLLPQVSRPAALLGSMLYPAQVCSRGWVERAFLPPRAHVSLRRPASNPIYFVRADRSPALESNLKGRSAEDVVFGVALDFWALTPICDPHPPACGQRTDPALGFASCRVVGHVSVQPIGLDPDSAHRPPGSHGPRFIAEPRNPYPLMGLKTTARLLPTAY
jgi:hypothetical protein